MDNNTALTIDDAPLESDAFNYKLIHNIDERWFRNMAKPAIRRKTIPDYLISKKQKRAIGHEL